MPRMCIAVALVAALSAQSRATGYEILPYPAAGSDVVVSSINDVGETAGTITVGGIPRPFVQGRHGWVVLPVRGYGTRINNRGDIAFTHDLGWTTEVGVRRADGAFESYGHIAGPVAVSGFVESDLVAGNLHASGQVQPFLMRRGSFSFSSFSGWPYARHLDLASSGATLTELASNSATIHVVVGGHSTLVPGQIPLSPHPVAFTPSALNDRGEVVGSAALGVDDSDAYVWKNGRFDPVAYPFPAGPAGWEVFRSVSLNDINNRGELVGRAYSWGYDPNSSANGVLLNVPFVARPTATP